MEKRQKKAIQNTCGKRSAADHKNHSYLFIANLANKTCLKQQKKVSQNTCAKCAATEQVNRSVANFLFRTYFSLPFFHSHLLFFAIFWCCAQMAEQNRTGLLDTSLGAYLALDIQFYSKLRRIVPVLKNQFMTNLFLIYAGTMALSGFGPYHGLWCYDTPSKHIVVTPTSGAMISALGFVSIPPKPTILPYFLECIFL
jgi:hypothetical protein